MEQNPPATEQHRFIEVLKQAGLRPTPQRLAVYHYLAGVTSHPTAQQIYEVLSPSHPSLSLATVYNTLETLVSLGIVNALGTAGDDAVHYDGDVSPHVNLACVRCHRVIDLPSQHVIEVKREVSEHSGYQVLGARVMYYGVCPSCQAALNDQPVSV
jgi:Fur family peroxide stress response transcriptional regulator